MLDSRIRFLKSMSKDVVINIIANAIPVVLLQFLVHPFIANRLGAEKNGLFVTLLALLHVVVVITSSSLSSTRLLLQKEYEIRNVKGDFNIYVCICLIINTLIVVGGELFYSQEVVWQDLLMITTLSLIWMVKDYLLVEFRLRLDYRKILWNNIFLSSGFLIGLLLFVYMPHWYTIFLFVYILSFVHAVKATKLWREPVKSSIMFSKMSNTFWKIVMAQILGMLVVNFDRLVLYPLIGGALVSIYYSASVIGKMISLVSAPISNVFLSYMVRMERMSINSLNVIYKLSLGGGVIFYIICLLVSPFILELLYPLWKNDSMVYVPITSAIAVVELIVAFTNPIVMKFCHINYQVKFQFVYLLLYAIGGLGLYWGFGLMGFAIGAFCASLIKAILIYSYARKSLSHAVL